MAYRPSGGNAEAVDLEADSRDDTEEGVHKHTCRLRHHKRHSQNCLPGHPNDGIGEDIPRKLQLWRLTARITM